MPRPPAALHTTTNRATRSRVLAMAMCCLTLVVGTVVLPSSPVAAYTTVVYNGAGNAPRISVIGDSVGSGIRWTNSYAPLRRFNFTFDAESCRRTIAASCRGREGYAPENVLTTMRRLNGLLGDVLVLMTGYNDAGVRFAAGVDAVMAEAARQGVPNVIWLTMRTADVSYVSPEYRSTSATFRDNNRILLQKAQQYRGALQIADWATYSAAHPSWVGPDGVHLSVRGAPIAADFIADMAGRVMDGATITPPAAPTGFGPAAVSPHPGQISVFVVGADQALYRRHFDGARWTGYTSLGGTMTSTPAVVSPTPGVMDVFARGSDYALWTRRFDGASWGPWRSLGGVLRSAPAVTSRSLGTIEIYAAGVDHALWTMRFDGSNWTRWSSLGGAVSGPPTAVSPGDGSVTVLARGSDSALWTRSWRGSWSGWSTLGGYLTTAPASSSSWIGTIDVFARGLDNAMWRVRFDRGWSKWTSLGGLITSSPAAVSFQPAVTALFARGVDEALWGTTDWGRGFSAWYGLGGVLR